MILAAAAAQFGRDLDVGAHRAGTIVAAARRAEADLLVLRDGTLGGYLTDLRDPPEPGAQEAPAGAGVHGRHRKVHLAPGESLAYAEGDRFAAFDTPVGRLGMMIDYDKTIPESDRTLAKDGAHVLACLTAWPASLTDPARRVVKDRQARLSDLYDQARAAENQVTLVSANQTGRSGPLTFLGNAKVVAPGGDIRAPTWAKAGLDPATEVRRDRRVLHHLVERRPAAYRPAGCAAARVDPW